VRLSFAPKRRLRQGLDGFLGRPSPRSLRDTVQNDRRRFEVGRRLAAGVVVSAAVTRAPHKARC
jgi:hypothetical protein